MPIQLLPHHRCETGHALMTTLTHFLLLTSIIYPQSSSYLTYKYHLTSWMGSTFSVYVASTVSHSPDSLFPFKLLADLVQFKGPRPVLGLHFSFLMSSFAGLFQSHHFKYKYKFHIHFTFISSNSRLLYLIVCSTSPLGCLADISNWKCPKLISWSFSHISDPICQPICQLNLQNKFKFWPFLSFSTLPLWSKSPSFPLQQSPNRCLCFCLWFPTDCS